MSDLADGSMRTLFAVAPAHRYVLIQIRLIASGLHPRQPTPGRWPSLAGSPIGYLRQPDSPSGRLARGSGKRFWRNRFGLAGLHQPRSDSGVGWVGPACITPGSRWLEVEQVAAGGHYCQASVVEGFLVFVVSAIPDAFGLHGDGRVFAGADCIGRWDPMHLSVGAD